ncbi:MAG: hypothetical protein LCI00_17920 [Chloroflexi bacterium]|nr:hypothetical protein [Chloroflexota bacterium]MCC6893854.1 hypothetical protein [Anaerolineae bacterium]
MRLSYRFASVLAVLTFGLLAFNPIRAQDTPLVCDSTLVTLLLVAEHNYGYLTNMQTMSGTSSNIEFGAYKPLFENNMMMQESMSGDNMDMSTEEPMMGEMMTKSNADVIKEYLSSMSMDVMVDPMSMLPTGALPNEDASCTSLRADVEHFLLVHTIEDMTMGDSMQ